MSATITCTTPQGRQIAIELGSLLSPALREQTRADANDWIKRFRLAAYGGASMRQRFTYRDDSLWWFTELYLHKMRRLDTAVATILALEAARDEHHPTRLVVRSPDPVVRDAVTAFGRAHGLATELAGAAAVRSNLTWPSYLIGVNARLSRLRASSRRIARPPAVAAFVHTAFWRQTPGRKGPRQEAYVGAVLDAVAARAAATAIWSASASVRAATSGRGAGGIPSRPAGPTRA